MKTRLFLKLIVLLCSITSLNSQQIPELVWTYLPTNSSQQFYTPCVKLNSENDIIFAGRYQGSMDFDDGEKELLLKGKFFIARLGQNKQVKWVKAIDSYGVDHEGDMYVDNYDNIYLCGTFYWTVDFDPGPGVFNLTNESGGTKGFVVKFDKDGNFVFAVKLGEGSRESRALKIYADKNQNILVLGYFHGQIDFNPGGTGGNVTSRGEADIYLLSLTKNGSFQWINTIGNGEYDYGYDIKTDDQNNIYITGNYFYDTDFDPGPNEYVLKGYGSSDGFIAKYSENGQLLWAKSQGCGGYDYGQALALDADNNVYVGGLFSSNCNFDTEGLSPYFTNRGCVDLFLIKYTENGDVLWARTIGGVKNDNLTAMVVDAAQNIVFIGNTNTIALFETTTNDLIIQSHEKSLLLAKYNPQGNKIWTANIGATGNNFSRSITLDKSGYLYVAGNYAGQADLNPEPGVQQGPKAAVMDLFLAKLNHCNEEHTEEEVSSAFPYKTASNRILTESGVYVDTIITISGCRRFTTIRYKNLNKIEALEKIKLGPVPCTDDLFLYLPEPMPGLETTLYTIDGKFITIQKHGTETILKVAAAQLIPGSYILEIKHSETRVYRKVVKQK